MVHGHGTGTLRKSVYFPFFFNPPNFIKEKIYLLPIFNTFTRTEHASGKSYLDRR